MNRFSLGFFVAAALATSALAAEQSSKEKVTAFYKMVFEDHKGAEAFTTYVGASYKQHNPLVRDGNELLPNVAHVFTSTQTLYFYYEVYDPAKQAKDAAPKDAPKGAIRLLTNVTFFSGKAKAFETPLVEATQLNAPERKAAAFEFQVPLAKLRPGLYTCQVNIIDDVAGAFAFPRMQLYVKP